MNYNVFKEAVEGKRIICFGAGKNAAEALRDVHILPYLDRIYCFVDNDAAKHGTAIDAGDYSFSIKSPECLIGKDDVVVLITVEKYQEIAEQVERTTQGRIRWFSWSLMNARGELDAIFYGVSQSDVNFILIYTPDYCNLGDHAIAVAERVFLKKFFGNRIIEIGSRLWRMGKEIVHEYIKGNDVLFITGGGFMGTMWAINEECIRTVINSFINNHIIIFPQSIYYGDTPADHEDLNLSKKIYNSHTKLLICTREKVSFQLIQELYPLCHNYLIPDMALFLNITGNNRKRDKIGFCMRDDKEGKLEVQQIERLYRSAVAHGMDVVNITNFSSPDSGITHENGERFVFEKLNEYRQCRLIITDRLHGMLFSVITSTPCIVLDNSYHKNRSLYDTWLQEFSYIAFIEEIETADINQMITKLLAISPQSYDSSLFADHYLKLADYICRLKGVIRIDG